VDDLDQLIAKHHFALGRGDILANLERSFVGLSDRQSPVAALQIPARIAQAIQNALAIGLDHGTQRRRIRGQHIGWRHRIDKLAEIIACLELCRFIEFVRNGINQACQPLGVEHPGATHEIECRIGFPFRIGKATISGQRCAIGHGLKEMHPALEQRHHRVTRFLGVTNECGADFGGRLQTAIRVGLARGGQLQFHAIERIGQQPLCFLQGLHQIARHDLKRFGTHVRKCIWERTRPKIIKVSTFGHQTDTRYSVRTYIRLNSFGIYESSKGNY